MITKQANKITSFDSMFYAERNNLSINVCSSVQDIESTSLVRVWTQSKRFPSSREVYQAKQAYPLGQHKINKSVKNHMSLSIIPKISTGGNKLNRLNKTILWIAKFNNADNHMASTILWMTLSNKDQFFVWSVLKIKSQNTHCSSSEQSSKSTLKRIYKQPFVVKSSLTKTIVKKYSVINLIQPLF